MNTHLTVPVFCAILQAELLLELFFGLRADGGSDNGIIPQQHEHRDALHAEGLRQRRLFFDCVMPARNARHAKLFTWEGAINLKNAKYERDMQPIDPACDCPVCRRYSRAYLRHLFKAEEMLAMRLSVMHNLYFYNKLMERIRQALDEGRFEEFRRTYSERLDRRI